MSTIFNSEEYVITGTGLTQTKSYNEGDANLLLDAITFDNKGNYEQVVTLTLDVVGLKQENFTLESSSEVAPIVATDADTYTISSQYIKSGYTQNVWADLTSTLAGLKLTFNNSDASDSYVITATLSDGVNTVVGTITITGNAVVDAVNIVQNLNIDEDLSLWAFNPLYGYGDGNQLLPQIADLDEAGKTYRVTITSPAAAAILYCASVNAVGASTYEPIVVLEGTQTQINDAINGTEGILYVMTGPDNTDPFTITWLQEVIGGATGAPYVQENGQFNFTITNVNAADTAVANFNYSEDTPTTPFSIATINDTRDRTTGLIDGNNYHATITLSNAASGSISPTTQIANEWVDEGAGVYTLSSHNGGTGMQIALNNVVFIPAVDYRSSSDTATLTLTRGHQQGDATWYISPNTNEQTLINAASITMTNVVTDTDLGYTVNTGPHDWTQHFNTLIDLATITDTRGDYPTVTYKAIIILDAPAAHANGEFRTFGSGGTSVWDGIDKITIEGDKTQINSHLATLEWWSRGPLDAFTVDLNIYRNINSAGNVLVKTENNIPFNAGTVLPSPTNTALTWIYNEDEDTAFSEGTTKAT